MTAVDDDDDLVDLLPDDLQEDAPSRGSRLPVTRSAKQAAAAEKRAAEKAERDALTAQTDAAKARAAQLAQIVNLHIGGHSFEDIGASIGCSGDEIERMLATETQRYVRTQPALRTYVRNFISGKYTELLDNVWDRATDAKHPDNLDAHDRAARILDRMARLHGAEAPIQKEVKVESSPEQVTKVVEALSRASGLGYAVDIFDSVSEIVDGEVVHDSVEEAAEILEVSGNDPDFEESDDEQDL